MGFEESEDWIKEAFSRASYPERYNHYLKTGIDSHKEMEPKDAQDIETLRNLISLTPLQSRILDDIEFLCRLDIFGGWESPDLEKLQDEWLEDHPNNVSCNERVNALLPIMENPTVPEKLKETMWYGLFLFNDYYADDYIPPVSD